MIKLKEIAINTDGPTKYLKGFHPTISSKDVGKYLITYKDEDSVVKGTRPYDTKEEAQKLVNLINDPNIVIKVIGFPLSETVKPEDWKKRYGGHYGLGNFIDKHVIAPNEKKYIKRWNVKQEGDNIVIFLYFTLISNTAISKLVQFANDYSGELRIVPDDYLIEVRITIKNK